MLPKTPPTKPGIRRLAIQTKDHTLKYADIKGKIPKGHCGAGTVTLRDRGGFIVEDPRKDEKMLFELSGSKMQGRYALTRTKNRGQEKESAVL